VELPEPVIASLLERWPVGRLGLRAGGGRPVVLPVVFAAAGGRLWSPVDGKPKAGAGGDEPARLRWLRHDPRACLLLDHYAEDWSLLWWLRAEGEAGIHREPDPEASAPFAAAAAALRRKYPQYAQGTPLFQGTPTLVGLAVERTVSWCASAAAARHAAGGAG